jgi:lipopolysaccharide export system protein LptC
MKTPIAVVIIIATLVAIATGWVYESKTTVTRPDLEIPSDIDYFLSEVKYQSMNDQGLLDFEMQSPYLEHLKVSNISLIEKPTMQIYREANNWQVESLTGKLFHEQNSLQLSQNVVMQRGGDNPMLIRAEEMLFQPNLNLVSADKDIDIELTNAIIHGSEAVFDLKNKVYSLKNTRAIYYRENS